MSLFKHTAAATETPETVIHEHHEPSHAPEILAGGALVFVLLVALWNAGVYVFAAAGARDPRHTFASVLLYLIGGVIVFMAIGMVSNSFFGRWLDHREAMEDKRLKLAQYQARMLASQSTDARIVNPQARRLHALIETIMVDAYHHGDVQWERNRPWARASAEAVILPNEREAVGYTLATRAKQWLVSNGVLVGRNGREYVNFRRYPDIASVQRKLADVPVFGVDD